MNKNTMQDPIKIVNNRVLKMLDSGRGNSDIFYRDVRTLTELIDAKFNSEDRV
jgi:hypothetical protein